MFVIWWLQQHFNFWKPGTLKKINGFWVWVYPEQYHQLQEIDEHSPFVGTIQSIDVDYQSNLHTEIIHTETE